MDGIWMAAVVGISGAILGFGAAYLIRERWLGLLLRYAAGVMIGVALFQLLPEAYALGSLPCALAGVVSGQVFCGILQLLTENQSGSTANAAALCAAFGIAAHNLPEGLAIGAGYAVSTTFGIRLALTILFHDIPEGAGVALPLRIAGKYRWKAFILTVLSGLPTAIGAAIAAGLGHTPTLGALCFALAFAAGAMLWVSLAALLPVEKEGHGIGGAMAMSVGILCAWLAAALAP